MIKDRGQKSQALKYVVGKRWFPQLEVDVLPKMGIAESDKPLTDIDVLACIPDDFYGYRYLLIDCKTKKKESPITRALWLKGLMSQFSATRGLCIFLKDAIEPDHRYTAAQQGVLLLTQDEFDIYATATGSKPDSNANSADIDRWELYFDIGTRFPSLAQTIEFCSSEYWMCSTESEACRKTITEAVRIRPELDPKKPEHVAIALDLAALFAHSIARVVSRIFASYLQPKNREVLSDAVLMFLYGGRDNYEHLNSMRKIIVSLSAASDKPITLPDWDRFVQLIRNGLDAPTELSFSPLILKEIAWSYLGAKHFDFAATLASEKRQAAKLALLATEYVMKAAKFPPEFASLASEAILSIQQKPGQGTSVVG